LSEFVTLRNTVKLLRVNRQVQSLLATDLRSDVHARYGLTQIHEALADYQANMTAGKVLIMPQLD
jgi:NADPH:quinone reductase-like Zn-dependent oxidoreductase